MELSALLPQLGTAGAFAWFAWKLYSDMRSDANEREKKSDARETKLMEHLSEQGEINKEVSSTLKNIHERLCDLEERSIK